MKAECGRDAAGLYEGHMVDVVQLVRTPDCGSGGREFESPHSPHHIPVQLNWQSGGFMLRLAPDQCEVLGSTPSAGTMKTHTAIILPVLGTAF